MKESCEIKQIKGITQRPVIENTLDYSVIKEGCDVKILKHGNQWVYGKVDQVFGGLFTVVADSPCWSVFTADHVAEGRVVFL